MSSANPSVDDPPGPPEAPTTPVASYAAIVVAASPSNGTAGVRSAPAGVATPGTLAVSSVGRRRPVDVVNVAMGESVVPVSVVVNRRAPPFLLENEEPNTKMPSSLNFAWAHARHGITLEKFRAFGSPRPDVVRLLRVADSDDGGGRRIFEAIVPASPSS